MIVDTFPAMGTTVAVTTDRSDGVDRVRDLFARVEQTCSRFLPDSELSRLNADPAPRRRVSPELASALQVALELAERTDGLVDCRLGADVQAWGYDRTFAEVRGLAVAPPPPTAALGPIALSGLDVERTGEVTIDLGGTAKGWTVDLAVDAGLARVVNAGGDVRSTDPRTVVHVDDPWGGVAARVRVGVGALATSSTAFRRWRVGAGAASHLIDPRTRTPVDSPVVSATALAATTARADAAAKAVLLQGAEGLAWARTTDWVDGALAVWEDGAVFATDELDERLM